MFIGLFIAMVMKMFENLFCHGNNMGYDLFVGKLTTLLFD